MLVNEIILKKVDQALSKEPLSTDSDAMQAELSKFIKVYCYELQITHCNQKMIIETNKEMSREAKTKADRAKLTSLENAEARTSILEPILYDTFIMVSIYFKEQIFLLSENVWAKEIHKWDSKQEWTDCYDKLKSLIAGRHTLA
jgi:hypothetical protein